MKKLKKKAPRKDAVVYEVRIYATSVVKLDARMRTRILGASNGLLTFSHRKPRSPKQQRRVVPLENVIQYGGTAEDGWVYLKGARTLIDRFKCIGEPQRSGRFMVCDLGDGITTAVNADADFEIHSLEDE